MDRIPFYILMTLFLASVAVLVLIDPIPQDQAYHNFGDKRSFLGIPNFWDVASNLPMLFIGAFCLWHSLQNWDKRKGLVERWLTIILSLGIFTAFFGSAYYHWSPDNLSLLWDRLPMTLMFMPLLSLLIYDYIGEREGRIAFLIAIPLGVFSVLHWYFTEVGGHGDLRLYAFVQFFPMVIVPFFLILFPRKVPYEKYIYFILGWYILAKLAEHFDKQIFEMLGFWSGHTIKHLLGSVSLFFVWKLIKDWRIKN